MDDARIGHERHIKAYGRFRVLAEPETGADVGHAGLSLSAGRITAAVAEIQSSACSLAGLRPPPDHSMNALRSLLAALRIR
ncbi:hypothetical protein GCM10008965_01150 [Methylorubrum aminovorans]